MNKNPRIDNDNTIILLDYYFNSFINYALNLELIILD